MEQFVITSNVVVWNRRKKAVNLTHELKNQSTQCLLCVINDGANSMIYDHASFDTSGCSGVWRVTFLMHE